MKIIVGTDHDASVVKTLCKHLEGRGHTVTRVPAGMWGPTAKVVAEAVAKGDADAGVVCCFTGTGVSIAANKVAGIRAALCVDAETARGARKWNDANVLALSLRLLTKTLAVEIADAFLDTKYTGTEGESLAVL